MKTHKTKLGEKIPLVDLELSHLENIIRWIEKKAIEGLLVRTGGGTTPDEMYFDEEFYYGKKAKKKLKYNDYKDELERRNKLLNQPLVIPREIAFEIQKCKESPYYFATKYLKLKNDKGEPMDFTTRLSEAEFNQLINSNENN